MADGIFLLFSFTLPIRVAEAGDIIKKISFIFFFSQSASGQLLTIDEEMKIVDILSDRWRNGTGFVRCGLRFG